MTNENKAAIKEAIDSINDGVYGTAQNLVIVVNSIGTQKQDGETVDKLEDADAEKQGKQKVNYYIDPALVVTLNKLQGREMLAAGKKTKLSAYIEEALHDLFKKRNIDIIQ